MSNDSLLNDLLNPLKTTKTSPCKIGRIVKDLPVNEQDALVKAVELVRESDAQGKSKVYSSVWLSKVLRKNGYQVSVSTVQRHVNKECYCE